MKINNKLMIILTVGSTIALGACKKSFLELAPKQNIDVSQTIKDITGIRAGLNGIYSQLQSVNNYGRTMSLLPDLMADNLYISVLNANRYQPQDQYVATANDGFVTAMWNNLYSVVANCNLVIEKAPLATLAVADTAERRALIGQAYSLRALAYFDLCRFFAQPYNFMAGAAHLGIPIVLKNGTDKTQTISPGRNTVKETYDQVIADLTAAIGNLSASASAADKGRFNLYAAEALLARVYLYKEDWQNAVTMASNVISSNKYSLLPNATFVTDFKKQNNAESIFEVWNTPTDNNGTDALAYFYSQSGYGDALATDDIYNSYKATDARKGFMSRGKRAGSGGENPANIVTKYSNVSTFDENVKVIRLAEMYLIRAEANAHLTNETPARADLNIIISRSDSDPSSQVDVTVTGPALMSAIINERRRELAFEGHRLFDLLRNKLNFTKTSRGSVTAMIAYPNNKTISPIPQAELDANAGIRSQQNPGY